MCVFLRGILSIPKSKKVPNIFKVIGGVGVCASGLKKYPLPIVQDQLAPEHGASPQSMVLVSA